MIVTEDSGQWDSVQSMQKMQQDLPNVKVGRFLVENRDERNSYQNTWSSGSTILSGRKASNNDKLKYASVQPPSYRLGGSSPYKPHHEEQDTPLRTLWENPKQQMQQSTMEKEESIQFEDSGYLSTFGGRSVEHQPLRSSFLSNTWGPREDMMTKGDQNNVDELESLYTDVTLPYARRNHIKTALAGVLTGNGESTYYEAEIEKKDNMNKKKRIVKKGGMTNVSFKNISKKKRRFCSDFYTTLLDASWTFSVFMFSASFYGSWIMFGAIYFLICHLHGDLENVGEDHVPCIEEVDGFASSFLFSLETQHTIGYGTRQTTTECPLAMLVVSLQAVIGCILQAFLVGLIFSKLSKPGNRSRTIIFSKHAVISLKNGKLCVSMRIGDLRNDNFVLGTKISLRMIRRRTTHEGETYQSIEELKVTPDTNSESCLFFVWPLDIVHVIDRYSPLYEMTAANLSKEVFELVLVMEGTNETSNMTFQARTSYLPQEILWGHRFEQLVIFRADQNMFQVNFSAFHSTYEVETPLYSAKDLEMIINRKSMKTSVIKPSPSFALLPDIGGGSDTNYQSRKNDNLSPLSISRANSNSMRKPSNENS